MKGGSEGSEEQADHLRQIVQMKLDQAREKLLEAKRGLEASAPSSESMDGDPFRKACLKEMANELEEAEAPALR